MDGHKITLDLTDEHLALAPESLRGAAMLMRGMLGRLRADAAAMTRLDIEIFEAIAAQLELARDEASEPVEVEFTPRGEQGAA